jgi:hypothetical protein
MWWVEGRWVAGTVGEAFDRLQGLKVVPKAREPRASASITEVFLSQCTQHLGQPLGTCWKTSNVTQIEKLNYSTRPAGRSVMSQWEFWCADICHIPRPVIVFQQVPKPTRTIVLSTNAVHEPKREDIMTDKKKDSEGTDQGKSEETAMDRKLDEIADKAAMKGIESEQRFDEEHGIFTKWPLVAIVSWRLIVKKRYTGFGKEEGHPKRPGSFRRPDEVHLTVAEISAPRETKCEQVDA